MPIRVDYVSDWKARLLGLIYEQFKGLPNIELIATDVLAPQIQDLEDSGQTLFSLPSIDDSEGVNLDVIGRIVNQPRGGVDDPTYRSYLRGRIAANRSSGTPEDLYSVFAVLYGIPMRMIYFPGRIASFILQLLTPITPDQASIGTAFLGAAKDAGVRAILEWQEDVDAAMFYTAMAATVRRPTVNGDLFLATHFTAGFPASGQLVLDPGLVNEETVNYTAIAGPMVFTIASPGVQQVHSIGAAAELVGDPGLGFGDSGDPSIGGKLEGAASAT